MISLVFFFLYILGVVTIVWEDIYSFLDKFLGEDIDQLTGIDIPIKILEKSDELLEFLLALLSRNETRLKECYLSLLLCFLYIGPELEPWFGYYSFIFLLLLEEEII